jgi:hypothetical protein
MSKVRLAVLIAILGATLTARPAAAHWSISLGLPLPVPVVPVAPPCGYAPAYPGYYPYYPAPYPVYPGAYPVYPGAYPVYPGSYVGFSYGGYGGSSYGPHRFGQPRYFANDGHYGGYQPKARGYTFH